MRKTAIIGISILSVFILCSLSYQPIIADTPIETITQANKSKASNLDVDEIKKLYNRLIELKSQSDCGCGDTIGWDFPIICDILFLILLFGLIIILNVGGPGIIGTTAIVLGKIFNCSWA